MNYHVFVSLCDIADYAARRRVIGLRFLHRLYRHNGINEAAVDNRAARDAENALVLTGNLDAPL